MKKYVITAGLLFALSGMGAWAQSSSTTPGVPPPNDPGTYPNPQASAPDQISPDQQTDTDHDRTSSDQQEYPDAPRDRRDNGQYSTDQDHQNQSDDMHRDRDQNRDRDHTYQNDQNYPQAGDQSNRPYDNDRHDRVNDNNAYGEHDRDRVSGNGYRDQIQSALQQANLNDVSVNDAGSRIELNGTVATDRDRRQAERIAQSYAHGHQVIDNIQVGGNGYERRDHDQPR